MMDDLKWLEEEFFQLSVYSEVNSAVSCEQVRQFVINRERAGSILSRIRTALGGDGE